MEPEQIKAVSLIALTCKAFNNDNIRAYLVLLEDIPGTILQAAVVNVLRQNKTGFAPPVGMIREEAQRIIKAASGETETDAGEQWGKVQEAVRRVGHYQRPQFADSITARVVEAIGWQNLCASDNPAADRAHFMKMYAQAKERHETAARMLTTISGGGKFAIIQSLAKAKALPEGGRGQHGLLRVPLQKRTNQKIYTADILVPISKKDNAGRGDGAGSKDAPPRLSP